MTERREDLDMGPWYQFSRALSENNIDPQAFRKSMEKEVRFAKATREYKKAWNENMLTPQLVDTFYQHFWHFNSDKVEDVSISLTIPQCDRSAAELQELTSKGHGLVLMPDEIMQKDGVFILSKMFPKMGLGEVPVAVLSTIEHTPQQGGCLDVEMGMWLPNNNIDETAALEGFKAEEREGVTLPVYITASQVFKGLVNRYFDEQSPIWVWSRLPGSRVDDHAIAARFESDGQLLLDMNLDSRDARRTLGARSQGRKNR